MSSTTITELKDSNDLGDMQAGDYYPANRGAGNTGVVTIPTYFTYLANITSDVQTQLNAKSPITGSTSIVTVGTIGTGTWQATVVGMTYGGTGANLTPSNGGIIYSNATTMAVLAGTATAGRMLRSGASTTPAWSTPTFPNAGTSRKIIVGNGTNYVESTETWPVPSTSGNVLQSDGTNWTSATPTGTGAPVLATSPTLTTPIMSIIKDTNGNNAIILGAVASAVNYLQINNASAAVPSLVFLAAGTSSDITMNLNTKGTGFFNFITAAATSPIVIYNGTSSQHTTTFTFANTAANRVVTFPDATGTICFPAVAADQETATSTTLAVTPAVQQRHPSSPKAWALFTSVTTTSITQSYNVTSLTDNGTGDTTVNFTTAFSANPSMHGTINQNSALLIVTSSAGTSSYRVVCETTVPVATDAIQSVCFFGDQ